VIAAATLASLAALSGGLHGVVTRAPTRPVCMVGVPCSAPAAGARLSFVRPGRTVRATADGVGRYRVTLAPGRWTVRIADARFGFKPRAVSVPRARYATQNFLVDTGIR
jgi:hypothetical protein